MTTVADVNVDVDVTADAAAVAPAAVRVHRTRADALRNRERIVAAARDVFVEYGPDAPLDEIARRAGIGNATLYRHFADRQALAHAVLLSVVTRTADRAAVENAAAAAGDDPCAALGRFAHSAVDDNIGALCGLLVNGDDSRSAELGAQIARLEAELEDLMERARKDGRLRPDVTLNDLMVAISRLTRPLPGIDCSGSELHRHLQLFLDGLKTPYPNHEAGDATTRTP
ncbi:TetR/AcrR family transcriptional regulator [Streptomyces sp. NPDC049040]|uniref:TetR/AcrR family transcriptional regulator n=1 Tax=Streptomyces sp. NPDC049040 TaxID=3365593 RepID=UPI00371361FA